MVYYVTQVGLEHLGWRFGLATYTRLWSASMEYPKALTCSINYKYEHH